MGLLDDAIREHLDLKRRRGADPTEVQRDEQEALGPVRRAQASQGAALEDERESEAGLAYDHEEEEGWTYEDEPAAADPRGVFDAPAEDVYDDPAESPPRSSREPARSAEQASQEQETAFHEPVFDEHEEPFPEADAEPAPAPRPAPSESGSQSDRVPPHPAGGETAEYDVEGALGAGRPEPAGDDEDMLEETPEFLQDTPDHDRLWFEQRPPKDFDFDG